jgi:hypothetical protein
VCAFVFLLFAVKWKMFRSDSEGQVCVACGMSFMGISYGIYSDLFLQED